MDSLLLSPSESLWIRDRRFWRGLTSFLRARFSSWDSIKAFASLRAAFSVLKWARSIVSFLLPRILTQSLANLKSLELMLPHLGLIEVKGKYRRALRPGRTGR